MAPAGNGSRTAERYQALQRYRVFMDHTQRRAPGHEDLSNQVKALGTYTIDTYSSHDSTTARNRSWIQTPTMLLRARVIRDKANKCLDAAKKEIDWRLTLESDIFSRFDVEIVCRKCRARLWNSELEVAVTDVKSSLEAPETSQKRPQSCQCPPDSSERDLWENGMSNVFDDLADQPFEYEEDINALIKKFGGRKPDKIIGLRADGRIKQILSQSYKDTGDPIEEHVQTRPFRDHPQAVLLPFLMLEVKSEKSPDAFSQIYLQTAFAIRALLDIQRKLARQAWGSGQPTMQPLVWYVASKGADWRISAAYVEETTNESQPNYRILELWAGNISHDNDALRLLLIIDHICHWAREIYRPAIIDSLLCLSARSISSLVPSSGRGSVGETDIGYHQALPLAPVFSTDPIEQFDIQHLLGFFDNAHTSLRDASYMRRQVCGLVITKDNLTQLFASLDFNRLATQSARALCQAIRSQQALSVSAACFNAMEELWTGKCRGDETFDNPEQRFLITFFLHSYLSEGGDTHQFGSHVDHPSQWIPHHELTYIAVAEDTLSALQEKMQFSPSYSRLLLHRCPRIPSEWIRKAIVDYLSVSTQDSLLRAVCRTLYQSSLRLGSESGTDIFPALHDNQPRDRLPCLQLYLEVHQPAKWLVDSVVQIPWLIYDRLKASRLEPSQSSIRYSSTYGRIESSQNQIAPLSFINEQLHEKLNNSNAILVMAKGTPQKQNDFSSLSRHCIFIIHPPQVWPESGQSSTRLNIYPNALETVYGVHDHINSFHNFTSTTINMTRFAEFLNHVSMQYQLIQSSVGSSTQTHVRSWIVDRYQALKSSAKASWHYSLAETMHGIRTMGERYKLGHLLEGLYMAYANLLEKGIEQSTANISQVLHLQPRSKSSVGTAGNSSRRGSIQLAYPQTNHQIREQFCNGPSLLKFQAIHENCKISREAGHMEKRGTDFRAANLANNSMRRKRTASISSRGSAGTHIISAKRRRTS